ncbi:MAG: hypothetical protein PHF51_04675 [Candidatus ainarchaeum sp.]|nr:hypothetical protein [Candidatus ainarchaeum sp.]
MAMAKRAENRLKGFGGADFAKATQLALVAVFTLLAFAFHYGVVRSADFYSVLVLSACGWLAFEVAVTRPGARRLGRALLLGLFLSAFDFLVETLGGVFGLWTTHYSALPLGLVPAEIAALCLVGGTAWALYIPKKMGLAGAAVDVSVFAFFGALGEALLIEAGLMRYAGGWNSWLAFAAYAVTFALLHAVHGLLFRDA